MPTPAALLAELVALPSVHPAADAGGSPPGEAALAAHVAARLRKLGAAVRRSWLAPGRPSVVAVFEPVGGAAATVLLAPHLDTVGVAGMTVPPFRLTRAGGRLHGRGACDTKGPMAALLWALERWAKAPAPGGRAVRWIVAASAGEEQGGLGAQALAETGLRADFAVALEPTDLRVVRAGKGVLRVWLETKGRSAHGSRPDRGINAIERALPLAVAVRREIAARLRARRHPSLGEATVNLGAMEGGGELNVVPDRCRLGLDIRTHPLCPESDALEIVRAACRTHARGSRVTVLRRGPAFVTGRRHPWAARLRACGRGWAKADWFCDANVWAAHGVPAVAFGPGRIAQAHTRDEFIEVRELEAGALAFLRFLSSGPAADGRDPLR